VRARAPRALCAALALAWGAGARAQGRWIERAPVPPDGADPEVAAEGTFPALEQALSALALEHGERTRLWSYGTSAQGRALLALELHPEAQDELWRPGSGPTWIVVADLGVDPGRGARSVLDWYALLSADADALAGSRWLLIPAPLPDRWEGSEPDGRPAWDFPAGWDPWSTPQAGAYPLRFPETRALAEGLASWSDVVGLVTLGAEERTRGGSLESYARGLGLRVLALPAPAAADVGKALGGMARVEPRIVEVSRWGGDLWQVELSLTVRTDAREEQVELRLFGARALALARVEGEGARPLSCVSQSGAALASLVLGPGETRLRLLVRGVEGSRASLCSAGARCAPRSADALLIAPLPAGGD